MSAEQTAITLSPKDPEAYNNLGSMLRELGEFNEAEKNHLQAIKLKPDYVKAYNHLGYILRELGRLDEAEQIYTKALEIEPENKSILRGRGTVFYDKEKFELALKDFNYCKLEDAKIKRIVISATASFNTFGVFETFIFFSLADCV